MSKQKRCIFVKERICPFQTKQVPFQTCQICIEAWKTEVAIKKQQFQGAQMTPSYQPQPPQEGHRVSLPVIENDGNGVINEKLKEIDQLLKDDKIDPLEYIRRRKEQVESLIGEKPKLRIDEIEEPPQEIRPTPKMVRVAVIVKSFFRKQVFTAPENWELPETITDNVINSIFKMAEKKNISDIKLRAGEYKIAGI
ncbi:MAG: hypothetical protein NWF07_04695, partial [Candidatus Bathyarchaeota archaeon]|nr:hypothetical protein [Candidatus Bathyarchaeota archaeon]